MSFIDPIIPEPDWGITSPSVDPDEWEDDDEDQRERREINGKAPR